MLSSAVSERSNGNRSSLIDPRSSDGITSNESGMTLKKSALKKTDAVIHELGIPSSRDKAMSSVPYRFQREEACVKRRVEAEEKRGRETAAATYIQSEWRRYS